LQNIIKQKQIRKEQIQNPEEHSQDNEEVQRLEKEVLREMESQNLRKLRKETKFLQISFKTNHMMQETL
jgi:hypothetical protein